MQQVTQHIQTPRGLTSLLETHFEIASYIMSNAETSDRIITINTMEGMDGLYELAEDLTFEFEHFLATRDQFLKEGEFYDLLQDFLDDKLK